MLKNFLNTLYISFNSATVYLSKHSCIKQGASEDMMQAGYNETELLLPKVLGSLYSIVTPHPPSVVTVS